jgi:hypothetical protein
MPNPSKEDVIGIIHYNKCHYGPVIKTQFPEFHLSVSTEYIGNSFGEKLYRWIHELPNGGVCKICNSPTKFKNISDGFNPYCSLKCSNGDPNVKKLKEETYLKKYGVKNPSQSDSIKKKKSETCLKHFGVENNLSLITTQERIKQTNLKNYGVEYPLQNDKVLEKQKATNLEKYGSEFVGHVKEFQEKRKDTCLQMHGVEYPIQSSNIHKKLEATNLKKYGAEHYAQSEIYHYSIWKKFYNILLNSPRLKNELIPMFAVEEYKGIGVKYKFQCLNCHNIFYDHMQDGRIPRCYVCYPREYSSYGEQEIKSFIQNLDSTLLIEQNTKNILKSGKELDIYLPTLHIAIEFNGIFWHSEIGGNKSSRYHLEKTIECENNGIRLIHVFEDEWLNKQEIVKDRIRHIIGYSNKSENIYARKCHIQEIDYKTSTVFLEKFHIQGKDAALIRLGLFHNSEMVSVMTFGKLRISLGNKSKINEYEMYRFCTSRSVIGAAGKLLSFFIKHYNPTKIISYADRRYSTNTTFYSKIGFELVGITTPNYFYTMNYLNRQHRFNFRKNILSKKLSTFDPNLTEWQNMQLNGYDRIWDCGNLKYEWKYSCYNKYGEKH